MVGAVARQAAHVISVVLPASPGLLRAIPGVALKTLCIRLRWRQVGRIDYVHGFASLDVLRAVAVAALARSGP